MSLNDWRQQGIIDADELNRYPVHVIGVGGIGSPTTMALTKMGIKDVTVYDPDIIEDHNLPNQIYRTGDINEYKVNALADICKAFANVELSTENDVFDGGAKGIVLSGVDSMKSRQEIWDSVKLDPGVALYIAARMGAEVLRIHTVKTCDPQSIEWYEQTLYSDEDATEAPCTERAIIYNVFLIAALMSAQVKKFLKGEKFIKEIIFDIQNMILLTK
jgi:hypothetical protein